jgi:DNA-binding NtrC family response regulator
MPTAVLIMEADRPFRRQISEGLARDRFKVFEAGTEQEALERVLKSRVDVVLLGLRGLRNRGIQLLRNIKTSRPRTEVILLTPTDCLPLSIEGMKLGAFDDLMIPFDMETLQRSIEEAGCKKRSAGKGLTSFVKRCQDTMVAVSFAEAGEPDVAREVMKESTSAGGRGKQRPGTGKPGKRQPKGERSGKV